MRRLRKDTKHENYHGPGGGDDDGGIRGSGQADGKDGVRYGIEGAARVGARAVYSGVYIAGKRAGMGEGGSVGMEFPPGHIKKAPG